jgi:hypothetical protein
MHAGDWKYEMSRSIEFFVGGAILIWLLLLYPAYRLGGQAAMLFSTVAFLLCLAPTLLTMLWTRWAAAQSPEQQLVAVLGGMGVRMGLVLTVGLALYRWSSTFSHDRFLFWLLVFYLLTLALEITLLVAAERTAQTPKG